MTTDQSNGRQWRNCENGRSSRIPAILIFALMLVSSLKASGTGALDHFVWSAVASPQSAEAPFTATLTAVDDGGNLVSNYSGNINISAETLTVTPMVISEVDNGTTNQVEFTNPSTNSVDISGWSVVFYDWTRWPQPSTIFTIPAGTICAPQSAFVVSAGGGAPGAFPTFYTGAWSGWYWFYPNPIAVALLNRTNRVVDFFCASTAFPYLITNPVPIIPGAWIAGPVPMISNPAYTFQRQGDFNHRQALDWIMTNRSIGILNSNLTLPFIADYASMPVLPASMLLTNGIWSGLLEVVTPGTNVHLHADNGDGNPGLSNPFAVISGPSLTLTLPAQTSSTNPGVQPAAITVPRAVGSDLVFSLMSDTPSKIGVPPVVVLAAGMTSAPFEVTNYNDSIIDGVHLVTITASNYLFPTAEGIITNCSAPVQLTLTLPSHATQQPGGTLAQAQLSTSVPVGSNFQAELFSSDLTLLTTPAFVQVPVGQTNGNFSLFSPNTPVIAGSQVVTVTAFSGPQAIASGSITVNGQPPSLTLVLPNQLIEGATSNGVVTIPGILPTNLTVVLTSSEPNELQVPATVVLPAGQTSVGFPVAVTSFSSPEPDSTLTVFASAPGFTNASVSLEILDDHVDHFAFAEIPLAQSVGQPFAVSISAQNESGDNLPAYSGFASLSAVGLTTGSLVPTQTGNFTNGQWGGSITINTEATNVVVSAQSGPASGQSNPFDVEPLSYSTLNVAIGDLIYDPGTDRIYATIPANSGANSNTVMRLNPYTFAVESYIPVDTNPGLMALSASNEYVYIAVQGGNSVERLNLASQLPDLEFALPSFYAVNLLGLPGSPVSVAIAGQSTNGASEDFIYDGDVERTNLAALALVPGLDNDGILNDGLLYLPNGDAANPTNQELAGVFPVSGLVGTGPVAPDPDSGSVFFLSQESGQTTIYTCDMATFAIQGSQPIQGVVGAAENLIRWGSNGLAFSTTGNQVFLIRSPSLIGPFAASLAVSQNAPAVATAGSNMSYNISVTNTGNLSATDVVLCDQLPAEAAFISAQSSQGTVEDNNGIVIGMLGTIPSGGVASLTVTIQPQAPAVLANVVSVATSAADSDQSQELSTWLTTVSEPGTSNQVAQLPIQLNDLVFNPADGNLYASVPGAVAGFGNSIVAINPASLQIRKSIPAGSEPGSLALSQDGRFLYVYLQSTEAIELVDLQTGELTFQASLLGAGLIEMVTLQGPADSLLLSTGSGLQIMTGGQVSALDVGAPITLIQPSLASNVFYGYGSETVPSGVGRVQVDGTNISATYVGGLTLDVEPEIRSGGDLLFFSSGEVVDPEAMIHLATFPGLAAPPYLSQPDNHICPDMSSGRVFYFPVNGSTITAYSLNTYQLSGTLDVPGIAGSPEQLVRWGPNGLAFATTGGQLFSIQSPLVPTNQPADVIVTQSTPASTTLLTNLEITVTVSNQGPGAATGVVAQDILPVGMRYVSASASQGTVTTSSGTLTAQVGNLNAGTSAQISILLSPDTLTSSFNYIRVAANEPDPVMTNNSSLQPISVPFSQGMALFIGDLVYDPLREHIFATVQSDGPYSNSIVEIDPITGTVEQTLPLDFEPGKITITSDSQFLYVGTTQEAIVARVNIQGWTNDLSFGLGSVPTGEGGIPYIAADFAPLPEAPHSVAVSMHASYASYNPEVAIFDDGIMRSNAIGEGGSGTYFIQCSPDASTLYVVNGDGYGVNSLTFTPYLINSSGIGTALTNIAGYGADFRIEDNLLIAESGQELKLQTDTTQGTFPVSGLVSPDLTNGMVYFLVQGGAEYAPNWTLTSCSTNMTNIDWQLTIPNATASAYSLTRCGSNTLAFATAGSIGQVGYELYPFANQLFFLNLAALPGAGDLVLTVATNAAYAGGNLTNTFTILNDGPYNATVVLFSNTLPGSSTLISATSTQGACAITNGVITCNIGSLSGGATVTITVASSVPYAGTVPLLASVSMNERDINPSNNGISSTEMIYSPPSATVSNIVVYRQNGVIANFNVVLSSPIPVPFSLYCSTTNGSAHSPGDYLAKSGYLTFAPGATNASFAVSIEDDLAVEPKVVFYVNISENSTSPPIATASCTLLNYDFYGFSATDISLTPPTSGFTNAVFVVQLSGSNPMPSSVNYFTQDGSAVSGRDYIGKEGTLDFPPGVTSELISIPIFGTANYAPGKVFYLVLTDPVNASLATFQVTASILAANVNPNLGPSQFLPDGRFQLTVSGGLPGQDYVLLASTNLLDWMPISGFVDTNPPVTIFDPYAAQYRQRFYRIGPISLAPPMKLGLTTGQSLGSNGFSAMLYALPGLNYEIDASTDLFNWQPLTNFLSTNSPFFFLDSSATNYGQRFYRAVMP